MEAGADIVLVHGAWADGSAWSPVIERLQASGYRVTAPQFTLNSLTGDVAWLRQVLERQDKPTIVAGHCYGGQIMTALGSDPSAAVGLVYIAAFGIDEDESIGTFLSGTPVSPALMHLSIDRYGFAWLPEDDYINHFAAGVNPVRARVMHATQQALMSSGFTEVMGIPAWRFLPAWYLIATEDQAIPPEAERLFARRMGATTTEVASGHLAIVSHPDEVTQLIAAAARACTLASS